MNRCVNRWDEVLRLPRTIAVAFFAILAVLAPAGLAFAGSAQPCSCGSLDGLIEQADAVFVGTVRDVNLEVDGPAGTETLWNFEVTTRFSGPDAAVLAVSGGGSLSNCAVDLEPGVEYGIVAFWRDGHLATSACGAVTPAQLTAALADEDGAASSSYEKYETAVWIGASAIAAVALGGAGMWLSRRRDS